MAGERREVTPLTPAQVNLLVKRIEEERVKIGYDFRSAMGGSSGLSSGWRGFFSRFSLLLNYDAVETSVEDWIGLISFAQGVAVGAGLLPPRIELRSGRTIEFNLQRGEAED